MFMGGHIVRLLVEALHPGWWAILYQLPVGFGMAYVLTRQQARPEVSRADILHAAAITGLGGTLTLWFLMMLSASVLTALLGIVGMWVGTSFGLDKYLNVDWESSQRITGVICGPIWVVWLIVGAIAVLVR